MKKKTTALFVIISSVLYFLAFLLPYLSVSGFFFYVFDFFNRFVTLLVPAATAALLLPFVYSQKPRRLLLCSWLLSLPHVFYTLFSYYLELYDYGFSTGATLLFGLLLSLLYAGAIGLLIFVVLLLLRPILSLYEKGHPLKEGYAPFDFGQKIPFSVGIVNMGYILGTLIAEIIHTVIFLSRHFSSYSFSEVLYMGISFVLIFAFFFPVQAIAVFLAKENGKAA